MAEEKTRRRRRGSGEDGRERRRSKPQGMSGAKVAARARDELSEITGLEAESVTSLQRGEDGGWTVGVEVLELSRIPNTDDMLGLYEVELDKDGELLGYQRLRRYSRSQADQGREPDQ